MSRLPGPDTRYMMLWKGEWRPVVNMFDASNRQIEDALRVVKAVLYVRPAHWVATLAAPGEIIERTDRDPNARQWEYVD